MDKTTCLLLVLLTILPLVLSSPLLSELRRLLNRKRQYYYNYGASTPSPTSPSASSGGCSAEQFQCSDGTCIYSWWECDGIVDCSNDEHEQCPSSSVPPSPTSGGCSADQFQCSDGTCIHAWWECDGIADCSNDEHQQCPSSSVSPSPTSGGCSAEQFQCSDGTCIYSWWECDGIVDCSNDEHQQCPSSSVPPSSTTEGYYHYYRKLANSRRRLKPQGRVSEENILHQRKLKQRDEINRKGKNLSSRRITNLLEALYRASSRNDKT